MIAAGAAARGRRRVRLGARLGALAVVALFAAAVGVEWRGARLRREARPWTTSPVDVNAAGAAELTILPGVGPSLAAAIVADRAAHGPFRSVDDLDRVRGIGPGLLARMRLHAVAGAPASANAYAAR